MTPKGRLASAQCLVLVGMSVLFAPRVCVVAYMAVWALWTALLRPLTGEPVWEALERADNYGVALSFLLVTGCRDDARCCGLSHRQVR